MNISKWLSLMLGQRTVYLCPPIHGQIFDHGKPLAHHPIHLWLSYDKEWNYETTTDENGCFDFPRQIFKTFKPQIFYGEEKVYQYLCLIKDNKKYYIWSASSPEYGSKEYPVIVDKISNVKGDIKNELKTYHFYEEGLPHDIPVRSFCDL